MRQGESNPIENFKGDLVRLKGSGNVVVPLDDEYVIVGEFNSYIQIVHTGKQTKPEIALTHQFKKGSSLIDIQ